MFGKLAHIALIFLLAALLLTGCAGKKPVLETTTDRARIELPTIDIPSFEWDKNRFLHLDPSTFPDSVRFFLPVGGKEFDIERAKVVEDVHGWAEVCDFTFIEYGHGKNANAIIVEDISASMGDYLRFTDNLIWGYLHHISDRPCEVSMVRFGKEASTIIDWTLPADAVEFEPESLDYPDSKGSDLAGALTKALDLAYQRSSSANFIVLFSDGDFSAGEIPLSLIDRANRYGVAINVLLHGDTSPGALAEIAEKTGGMYVVQPAGGFSPGMVADLLEKSYFVTYQPVHQAEDGVLHRVAFENPGRGAYRGEYRAPGEFHIPEIEPVVFELPDELSKPVLVPFGDPGNQSILPDTTPLLDSLAAEVNAMPETLGLELYIKGYACNLGSASINLTLSKERAYKVRDYLRDRVNGNVSLDVSWFGEMYPLNSNTDEDERRANRRVEITVLCPTCG